MVKFGQVVGNVLRKVGDVGGKVVNAIGQVKGVMDRTGATKALTGFLAADPMTAPLAAGLVMGDRLISGAKAVTGGLSNLGRTLGA